MARYRGPRLRVIRRLGELPGLTRKKMDSVKSQLKQKKKNKKMSEYAIRLQEKQKLRFNYGVNEKQLLRYIYLARKVKGSTGQVLLQLLEMRLDNTVFRLGMAPTIPAARQLVNHGHIYVNSKRVSIPSFQCKPGDTITVKENTKSIDLVEKNLSAPALSNIPSHLELDREKKTGVVNGIIERSWVALTLNELLVVEFYSRK
uniref:Ribosomal protein S4 n=1 Tax=Bangiopsis subsimplex TaxID=139980 RepID=A0A1C9CCV3_9RHOD|nr:ribosomal protein S4 [Bangiopsis subsimplex]AOM66187.1 ribosomal protein S4 [Bangiopsis subsimplex]ARO90453.1 30S ribosomal protein S4 [Bangiopsis subsimplex]